MITTRVCVLWGLCGRCELRRACGPPTAGRRAARCAGGWRAGWDGGLPQGVIILDRQRVIGLLVPPEPRRVVSGYIQLIPEMLGMDVSAVNGNHRTAYLTDFLRLSRSCSPGPPACQHPDLKGRQPFAERWTISHLGGKSCRDRRGR